MLDGITNILVVGIGWSGRDDRRRNAGPYRPEPRVRRQKTEVAGMAQRGGWSPHVRFGPKIYSPQIDPGEADLLIGFEAAEALRWLPYLPHRRRHGQHLAPRAAGSVGRFV